MATEKWFIDAGRFLRVLRNLDRHFLESGMIDRSIVVKAIITGLKIQPKVDVVKVVRCKDCKKEWCYLRQELGVDGFCSAGERKDNGK